MNMKIKHLALVAVSLLPMKGWSQYANPYAHKDSVEVGRNVYGPDDRKEASNYGYLEYTHATAVAVQKSQFNGNYLNGNSLGDKLLLQYDADFVSSEVAFRDQPAFGFCTGFLIAPDLLVTAGHCIDKNNYQKVEWIFDYTNDITKNYKPKQSIYIDPNNRYRVKEVITSVLDDNTLRDYALVRLDRPTNRAPYLFRTSNKITPGEKVNMIGAPSGIPLKLVEKSNVVNSDDAQFFTTDLDAFGGNSGGPVYNIWGQIEGILVRGPSKGFYVDEWCNCVKTSRFTEEEAKQFLKGVEVQKITDMPWNLMTNAIYDNLEYAIKAKDKTRLNNWLIYSWIKDEKTVQTRQNLMLTAVQNNNIEAMQILLDKKWSLNIKDSRNRSLWKMAVDAKSTELMDFLIKKGIDPNEKDEYGNNALFWAINNYDPTTLDYLLKKGVSVYSNNSQGDYLLHAAVRMNSFMMVEALLNNGADLSVTNADGYTPRKLAKKLKYKSLKKYLRKREKS